MKIKQTGGTWELSGTTVTKGMDDLETLFRIAIMRPEEFLPWVHKLPNNDLANIAKRIREYRAKAALEENGNVKKAAYALVGKELPRADVTNYVVKTHTKRMGWVK